MELINNAFYTETTIPYVGHENIRTYTIDPPKLLQHIIDQYHLINVIRYYYSEQ